MGGVAMMTRKRILLPFLLLLFVCSSESRSEDRQPAVAGQFYPGTPAELKRMLDELFSKAVARKNLPNVIAIIVPHAGYLLLSADFPVAIPLCPWIL
jgi:hypothetical protein